MSDPPYPRALTLNTTGVNAQTLWRQWQPQGLLVFLALVPLCLVTVRSWSGALLILGATFCLISLLRSRPEPVAGSSPRLTGTLEARVMLATLIAPVLVIGLSSTLRGQHNAADYDAASRFLLAALVFVWVLRRRANALYVLQITIPVGLIATLLQQIVFPQPRLWGPDRMATYFADPLVFGYTSLTLGLICLLSIHTLGKDAKALVALKLTGAMVGFYLSVQSGSRTGWLAAPLVLMVWFFFMLSGRTSGHIGPLGGPMAKMRGHGKWLLLAAVLLMVGFALSAIVQQRMTVAVHEVMDYPWQGIAPETSVGFRITFLRIAADLFASNPWVGFGDTRQPMQSLPAAVYTYASPEAIRMSLQSGFHNELVTQAIRSGVGGLLSAAALFFAPLWVCFRQMRSPIAAHRGNALAGLILVLGLLVSSFSTEVFDLKYTASFYALMVALLCGSALAAEPAGGRT